MMKAFIFAGGNGSRMDYPLKPTLRVGNDTIIGRLVRQLDELDLDCIIIGVCDERIKDGVPTDVRTEVKYSHVNNPEDSMICTLASAEPLLEGETRFITFCADEVYSDSVIAASMKLRGNGVVMTPDLVQNAFGTTSIVSFDSDCFKFINNWIRDRDQMVVLMKGYGYNIDVITVEGYVVNINTWDSYRYARDLLK